jgi:hypothetical protein
MHESGVAGWLGPDVILVAFHLAYLHSNPPFHPGKHDP